MSLACLGAPLRTQLLPDSLPPWPEKSCPKPTTLRRAMGQGLDTQS